MSDFKALEEVQSSWDEYQNELVRKFYGGEPKAKKPLPVYNAPPNSIIVPGLAGDAPGTCPSRWLD